MEGAACPCCLGTPGEEPVAWNVLPPDRARWPSLVTHREGIRKRAATHITAALTPTSFPTVTPPPPAAFPWSHRTRYRGTHGRLLEGWSYDYGCTSVVECSNRIKPFQLCLGAEEGSRVYSTGQSLGPQQFWANDSGAPVHEADDDIIIRLFRVQNIMRLQEGQLVVRHFQFLRWSPYRDVPDSKKAFLSLWPRSTTAEGVWRGTYHHPLSVS
ncbi:hypothetical protein J4Q44_G00032560 [Coregonus suidteri]|uniref:Uncharacterized protein n=1 Tax=Coregonus suidteri TaxID=861788 RepID=A0AAN8MID8_9TELE